MSSLSFFPSVTLPHLKLSRKVDVYSYCEEQSEASGQVSAEVFDDLRASFIKASLNRNHYFCLTRVPKDKINVQKEGVCFQEGQFIVIAPALKNRLSEVEQQVGMIIHEGQS